MNLRLEQLGLADSTRVESLPNTARSNSDEMKSLIEILKSTPSTREDSKTVYEVWRGFVEQYPNYFAEEENPVIVLPASMGGSAPDTSVSKFS